MKKSPLLSNLHQMLYKSSLFAFITATSLAGTTLVFNSKAEAQSIRVPTTTEIRNYADVLLKMEPQRQRAFEEIKKTLPNRRGGVPTIVCNDNNSINGLPGRARSIAVRFCQRYQRIVEDNDMDIDRFNEITESLTNNDELKNSIYERLLEIQNQ
ncbi:MAG: DUF4168 domain-containing protein [Calothrix sp. MO_192.B10]|nr:DUF4168 domain-containing protein [Calothrix sp. MO_192.B10]